MKLSASGARKLLAIAALAPLAAVAGACGSTSTPGGQTTVTVTAPAGGGSSSSSPSAIPTVTGRPASPPECGSAGLHVKVGAGNGAAGTSYYNLDITNTSNSTCFLMGYPGVSLVSAGSTAGSQIGADAKRNPAMPSKQIDVAPGKTAHAVLGVADAGNFPASRCNAVTAHWLKFFPPDQTVALYAPFTTQTCASTSVATLHITTITAGA